MSDQSRLALATVGAIPSEPPDIIEWAKENVKMPSSARSPHFDATMCPWIIEPILRAVDKATRRITLMKPVQTGGSSAGEVVLLYWLKFMRGFFQYNWSNNKRADERWVSRIRQLLLACNPIAELMNHIEYSKGEVHFGRILFRMQGAFESHNLDSDTVNLQINEEVHDWEPGHLEKARNRLRTVWNYKSFDISNAGIRGDQLDEAFKAGTVQLWEIKCPGCHQHHVMHTKWDENRPDLGGLRYDAEGCRVGFGEYDYKKLRPTINYEFPCGFKVHNEDASMRRRLSREAAYSEPTNKYAELKHRSYTYDAVIVDFIDWMDLIVAKHKALKARAQGNNELWIKYTQENECIPFHEDDIPITNNVEVTVGRKKLKEGLLEPRLRSFGIDRQQGEKRKGELPYWWLVIRDFKIQWGVLKSVLVYEGRLETDEQVAAVLNEHRCIMHHGCADSGDDTEHVYQFCYRYGINPVKGGVAPWYVHDGNVKRAYGVEQPLHKMMNMPHKFPYVEDRVIGDRLEMIEDDREPMFWLYSRPGIAERLYWLERNSDFEIPDDVSLDYKQHRDAEDRVVEKNERTGFEKIEWHKMKSRNDLLICERYAVMMLDRTGLMGGTVASDVVAVDIIK